MNPRKIPPEASNPVQARTTDLYGSLARDKGLDRNSILNPEVDFQAFAARRAVLRAFAPFRMKLPEATLLDVGCGGGGMLPFAIELGLRPERLMGVDLQPSRVAAGKRAYPQVGFVLGDGRRLGFRSEAFDFVVESTMFVHITDDALAAEIAREMVRVTSFEGRLILIDWDRSHPTDSRYRSMRTRFSRLFPPSEVRVEASTRGALIPPLGRLLSRYLPSLYFPMWSLFPFLSFQRVWTLRRVIPDRGPFPGVHPG